METSNKHLQDLSEIRQIMERSTKFLSLSGWAGIVAGILAILGTLAAYFYLDIAEISYDGSMQLTRSDQWLSPREFLITDALIVLVLALTSAIFFSYRKAKRSGQKLWTPVTKRLLFHLFIPLAAGGILSLILILQNQGSLIVSLTLVFYGMALVNAGKYTDREIIWLGIAEILTGLAASIWQQFGLWFWAAGFGVFHIIYGIALYYKYDRLTGKNG